MKIIPPLLAVIPALFFAGCNTMLPHSSTENLSLVARHPERHQGELVSTFGEVLKIDAADGRTVFQLTTPNFVFSFLVSYPGEVPGLMVGQSAYFLGRVTGSEVFQSDAYTGLATLVKAVTVDAVAVQPVGGTTGHPFSSPRAVYRPEDQAVAQQWLAGDLDLTEPAYRGAPTPRAPAVVAAPVATRIVPAEAAPAPAAGASGGEEFLPSAAAPASSARVAASEPRAGTPAAAHESRALKKFMKQWDKLPPEDQARFLELVGQKAAGSPSP